MAFGGLTPRLRRKSRSVSPIFRPGTATRGRYAMPYQYEKQHAGLAVAISPDNGFKYTSFFADVLGDEGLPRVD